MNQEQFEATTSDDLRKMTPEELAAWAEWEPEPVPLTSFPLGSEEGRKAFLREFYGVGWDWLFLAVSHVWDSLAEPQAVRCTLMGIAAGTGGTGKKALIKVLAKFLTEALEPLASLPPRADYDSLEAWHLAAMATWQTDEARLCELLTIYADILDGKSHKETSPLPGQILLGPWAAPTPE